jgi:hypothetical protein
VEGERWKGEGGLLFLIEEGRILMQMRIALAIPALLLVLGACESVEPPGPGPAPLPALAGMITFGSAQGKDTYGGLAITPSGEILFAWNGVGSESTAQCTQLGAGGAAQWTTRITRYSYSAPVISLTTVPDGRVLILTEYRIMWQLAPSGDSLWTWYPGNDEFNHGIQLRDGLCVLSYDLDWRTDSSRYARLLCYDRTQGRTWTAELLPTHPWTWISCIVDVGDGTVLAGGETSASGSYPALLVRLNPVTQARTVFPIDNTRSMDVIAMSEVRNGEFGMFLKETTGSRSPYETRYIFMRWSVDATLLHQRQYTGRAPSSIAWTPDGGFAIAGNDDSAVLTKTDAEGSVQWEYVLSRPPWKGAHDAVFPYTITARRAVAQPDGGIVWGGTTDAFGSGLTDAWLMRLHADGSVDSTFGR